MMMMNKNMKLTINQCLYHLERAKQSHNRALKIGEAAAIERTSDQIGKWEVNLRIAKGQSEKFSMDAVFGK